MREALRSQQVTTEDAEAVAETGVHEGHQAALAELVLLLCEDRWMIRLSAVVLHGRGKDFLLQSWKVREPTSFQAFGQDFCKKLV